MRSKKIKLSIMKRIAILFSVALILSVPITMALNHKFMMKHPDLKSFGTLKDTLLTSFGNNEKTRRWVLTFFEEE